MGGMGSMDPSSNPFAAMGGAGGSSAPAGFPFGNMPPMPSQPPQSSPAASRYVVTFAYWGNSLLVPRAGCNMWTAGCLHRCGDLPAKLPKMNHLVMAMRAAPASLLRATSQHHQRTTQQPQQRQSNLSQRQRPAPPSRSSRRRCRPLAHQRHSSQGDQPLSMWMTKATAVPWLQLHQAVEPSRVLGGMRWGTVHATHSKCMCNAMQPDVARRSNKTGFDQDCRIASRSENKVHLSWMS